MAESSAKDTPITSAGLDEKFVKEYRFFPRLDALIDVSRQAGAEKIPKALIKAYCLLATEGDAFYVSNTGYFQRDLQIAAHALGTTPGTVAAAVESTPKQGRATYCRFEIDLDYVTAAIDLTRKYRLPEVERVRLSLRAGLGLLPLYAIAMLSCSGKPSVCRMDNYLQSEQFQMDELHKFLAAALGNDTKMIARAVTRVRYGEAAPLHNAFGLDVWREMNRLYAQGHSKD